MGGIEETMLRRKASEIIQVTINTSDSRPGIVDILREFEKEIRTDYEPKTTFDFPSK